MGVRIAEEKIEQIRKQTDIVEVINDYVQLKKQGRNYIGLCPFHGEKTPSFSVSADKQLYHCFGCGAGGNVFTFLMELEGLTFVEAVRKLAKRVNVSLPEVSTSLQKSSQKHDEILSAHDLAASYYHYLLMQTNGGEPGRDYLSKRGFLKEMMEYFQIGFAPNAWDTLSSLLQKRQFNLEKIERAGLISTRQFDGKPFDRFRNRVMFPIWDGQGKVIAFGGRVIDDSKPKYLNSPESAIFNKSKTLYAFHLARPFIRKENEAILFEGYLDVTMAWQAGVKNGVATLGTSLTEEQAKLIRRNAESVIICYDSDEAGIQATYRAAHILEDSGCYVKIAQLPDKHDPDDYIRLHGGERFRKDIIGESLTLMAFKMRYFRMDKNLQDEGERLQYIEKILEEISKLTRPVERDHYLRQLAEEFSLSLSALKQEQFRIYRQSKQRPNNVKKEPERSIVQVKALEKRSLLQAFENAERFLLAYMMRDREIAEKIQEQIADSFNVDLYQAIATHLYAYYGEGNEADISRFLTRLQEKELMQVASEIAMLPLNDELTEEQLNDYVREVKNYPKRVKLQEEEQRLAQSQDDPLVAAQIAMEIIKKKQALK